MPYATTLMMHEFVTHDVQRRRLSNTSEQDVICALELEHYLGDDLVPTFTREHDTGQAGRRIDATFLAANIGERDGHFDVCGPDAFVADVNDALLTLGVHPEQLVYER